MQISGKPRSSARTVRFEAFVWYTSDAGEAALGDTSVKLRGGVQAGDEFGVAYTQANCKPLRLRETTSGSKTDPEGQRPVWRLRAFHQDIREAEEPAKETEGLEGGAEMPR